MPVTHLAPQYENLAKQFHAARLGMWVFLGSEALLFSGLFTLYAAYRVAYPIGFAQAALHTNLALGTLMTITLIASSFLMAMSVRAGRSGQSQASMRALLGTLALGAAFLALKALEYDQHFQEGIIPGRITAPLSPASSDLAGHAAVLFFTLYYFMTGLHALHVLIGLGLIAWLAQKTRRLAFDPGYYTPLELGGMYWHFVDIIWLFLWPLFYLLR